MFLYKPQIEDDGKKLMCKVENPEQNLVSDYIDLHVVMFSTDLSSSKIKKYSFESIVNEIKEYHQNKPSNSCSNLF